MFFLSIDEILAVLGGNRASLAYLSARRAAYQRYCALPSYPVLIPWQFDPFQWATDPPRRSDLFELDESAEYLPGMQSQVSQGRQALWTAGCE